jgi:hypothetical protein
VDVVAEMTKAAKCFKQALMGSAIALSVAVLAACYFAAMVWFAAHTAAAFSIPEQFGVLVFLAYVAASLGALGGGLKCWSEQ